MKNDNALTPRKSSAPPQVGRPPGPMHIALYDAKNRALRAIEDGKFTTQTLATGPHAAFERRRVALREALCPAPRSVIAMALATLSGMAAKNEGDLLAAKAQAKLDIMDVADLPAFALIEAIEAYRRGQIGDGRWRPTAGELRKEALRRALPAKMEVAQLDRILAAADAAIEPRRPITREHWDELRRIAAGGETVAD